MNTYIHNVGHGQAVHVFLPDGKTAVVDLGCSADFSPLEWLSKITKEIDLLVITHPHGDHIDEIHLIRDLGFAVHQLWRPSWLTEAEVYAANQASDAKKVAAYLTLSNGFNQPLTDANRFDVASNNSGAAIEMFISPGCGRSNINNHSLVVACTYEESTVIIPGDNEPPSWNALLLQSAFVKAMKNADIFMASHHGRKSGYCAEIFAEDRKPLLCAISDGRQQDTDATDRYSYHAKGWAVHKRSEAKSEQRCAITTRTDGLIEIKFGRNSESQKRFVSVTAD